MQSWSDLTEIVAGLALQRKINLNCIRPEQFSPPYNLLVKYIKTEKWIIEDVIGKCGLSVVQTAMDAYEAIASLEDKNWIMMLETAQSNYQVGIKLEKLGKLLQQGEAVDLSILPSMTSKLNDGEMGLVPLSEVIPGEVPFIKTGWKPIDSHLGGIPEVGLILAAGNPGVGKTSFLIKLVSKFVQRHKKKKAVVFTLEMLNAEFANRFNEIDDSVTVEDRSRILMCDEILTVDEIINKAAAIQDLGFLGIDFADLMIPGEVDESKMAIVYKSLASAAKHLKIPILLLGQLSRNYKGGIPRPHSVRYTSLAEALSWMILMLYSPSRDYFAEESMAKSDVTLPTIPGKSYIVCWKSRGGFRVHGNPGAIQVNWNGELSWGDAGGKWFTLSKGVKPDEEETDS